MSKITPEEVLRSVTECINTGNVDSLMTLYESDACFASQPGQFIKETVCFMILSLSILLFTSARKNPIYYPLLMWMMVEESITFVYIRSLEPNGSNNGSKSNHDYDCSINVRS